MKKISAGFFLHQNVVEVARFLLGKVLVTNFDGKRTAARIVETEAYIAITDKASHSYAGKRTARNEHMYGRGGTAYVYICYGMHHLFNVVTNEKDIPDAVLIRAAEPVSGVDMMLQRTGRKKPDYSLTRGPGNMSRALGISKQHSGMNLRGNELFIAEDGYQLTDEQIGSSKRIGIDSAGDDAFLPYRFYIRGNKYVSASPVW